MINKLVYFLNQKLDFSLKGKKLKQIIKINMSFDRKKKNYIGTSWF